MGWYSRLASVLTGTLFALVVAAPSLAQSVGTRFSTEKRDYLVGEPVFVSLAIDNKTAEPLWLDFQPPSIFHCGDFSVEVPGAGPADEAWGCGFAGSCGRGLWEIPPGKSTVLRQLVNQQFRLRQGVYSLHAQTSITVRTQNLFDAPKVEQLSVSETLRIEVRPGNENELEYAFRPVVVQLNGTDLARRAGAATAITELAPPFLEDILIELTKTPFAHSAIAALRKADTPKTRATLAQIGLGGDEEMLRVQAIQNLGRTKDAAYLPTLFQLMESSNKAIQNAAAVAAGTLGGTTAVQRLTVFINTEHGEARIAGTEGLGQTHAREAVPILIGLLLDPDSGVRQSATSSLWLLTHYAAFDGDKWADISTRESAASVHQRWVRWWESHGSTCEVHGMADCTSPQPLD